MLSTNNFAYTYCLEYSYLFNLSKCHNSIRSRSYQTYKDHCRSWSQFPEIRFATKLSTKRAVSGAHPEKKYVTLRIILLPRLVQRKEIQIQ